jgi:hypothetical protein
MASAGETRGHWPAIDYGHLIAAREIADEIQRALEAANGTAPPTINGEAANAGNAPPPDLYTPALE